MEVLDAGSCSKWPRAVSVGWPTVRLIDPPDIDPAHYAIDRANFPTGRGTRREAAPGQAPVALEPDGGIRPRQRPGVLSNTYE